MSIWAVRSAQLTSLLTTCVFHKKFGSCFKDEMGCQWDNLDALIFFSFFFLLKVIVSSISGYEAVNVCIYLV